MNSNRRRAIQIIGTALCATVHCGITTELAPASTINGGFESGGFDGWIADPNWVVVDNSCGFYSGWEGKRWAWSGGKGEPATGVLKSKPFLLDKDTVQMLVSGWNSISGSGQPRKWNYVTLNLEDGTEIDREYAPNTTVFVPIILDGSKYRGKMVYVKAVDDADQPTFSMLCIDDVHTAAFPFGFAVPVKKLSPFDPRKSLKLENSNYRIEVDRKNGSITRIRDKKGRMDLILEPRLAGSYRFSLPIPGKEPWQTLEANWIFGKDQKLSSHQLEPNKLRLHWKGPLKNYLKEQFKASATMTIELQESGVLFSLSIDNQTEYAVGETYFPILGGLQGLGKTQGQLKETEMVLPSGTPDSGRKPQQTSTDSQATASGTPTFTTTTIFRVFTNMSWLGDQGPEQFYAYPKSIPEPWVGFAAPGVSRAAIIGAPGSSVRNLFVRLELIPASSGNPRDDGNWPRASELRGAPVGVELSLVDTKGGDPGKTYGAEPVLLRFIEGGAEELLQDYGKW